MNFSMSFKRTTLAIVAGVSLCSSICQAGGDLPLNLPYIPHDAQYEIYKAIGQDKRLQASVFFLAASSAMLSYAGFEKVKKLKDLWDSKKGKHFDEDAPLQELVIKNVAQRNLDYDNPPELIDKENNHFVTVPIPIIFNNGNCLLQLKVLHQSLTDSMHPDEYAGTGIIVEKFKEQYNRLRKPEGFFAKISKLFSGGGSVAGGNLSCGYQAIKNVALLLNALHAGNDDDQYNESIKMLQDINYAVDLFGQNPSGMWRRFVEEMRKRELLKWYLDTNLSYNKFLIHEKDTEHFMFEQGIDPKRILSIYNTIARDLHKKKVENELAAIFASAQLMTLTHTKQELIAAIKACEAKYDQENGEEADINDYFKSARVINQYLKLNDEEHSCKVYGTDTFLKKISQGYERIRNQQNLPEISLDGENLSDSELQQLIEFEQTQENGLLHAFKQIPDSIVQDDVLLEDDGEVIKEIKDGLKNRKYCHVLYLHGDAHWIAFIINKVNDVTDYIVADSLNVPRYGAPYVSAEKEEDDGYVDSINNSELVQRIHKIIQSIEGEDVFDAVPLNDQINEDID